MNRGSVDVSFTLNITSQQWWYKLPKFQRDLIATLGEYMNDILINDYMKQFICRCTIRLSCLGGSAIARDVVYYEPFAVCHKYYVKYKGLDDNKYNLNPTQMRIGLLTDNGVHSLPQNMRVFIQTYLKNKNTNKNTFQQLIDRQTNEITALYNFYKILKNTQDLNIKEKIQLTNINDQIDIKNSIWNEIIDHMNETKNICFFDLNFYDITYYNRQYVLITPGITIHNWYDYATDNTLEIIRKSLQQRINDEIQLAQTNVYLNYDFNKQHEINNYSIYIPQKSETKHLQSFEPINIKVINVNQNNNSYKKDKNSNKKDKNSNKKDKNSNNKDKNSNKKNKNRNNKNKNRNSKNKNSNNKNKNNSKNKNTNRKSNIFKNIYKWTYKHKCLRNYFTGCVLTPKFNDNNQIVGYYRMKFFDKFMEYIWNKLSTAGQPLLAFLCAGIRIQQWRFKFKYKKFIIEILEIIKYIETYSFYQNKYNFKFKGFNFFALNSYNIPDNVKKGLGLGPHKDNIYTFEPEVVSVKIGDGTDLHFDSNCMGCNSQNVTLAVPLRHGEICVFES